MSKSHESSASPAVDEAPHSKVHYRFTDVQKHRTFYREAGPKAPAESVELWSDFSNQLIGAERTLQSLSLSGDMAMGGMMDGGMMESMMGDPPNGAPFPILKARVERRSTAKVALPQQLSAIPAPCPWRVK